MGNRTLYSRWVINCAGLFSDKVAALLGLTGYEIYPCRGEYFLLDERLSSLLPLPRLSGTQLPYSAALVSI